MRCAGPWIPDLHVAPFRYRADVLRALERHGVRPTAETSPQLVRDYVRDLYKYEIRQLKANLVEAALLYSGIPVTNVTTLTAPLQSVADAIAARDGKRFTAAYGELTGGCNACHQSMERGFVSVRIPAEQSFGFGDQNFAPQGRK